MSDTLTSYHDAGDEDELVALLQAIAACSLQDVTDLQSDQKGKSREGLPRSDAQLAMDLFAQEANDLLSTTRDLKISLQLEKAMRLDAQILEEHRTMEDRASRDREMALALSQGRAPPPRPPTPISPETSVVTSQVAKVSFDRNASDEQVVYESACCHSSLRTCRSENEDDGGASSSQVVLSSSSKTSAVFSTPRPSKPGAKRESHDCVICCEKILGVVIRVSCGHFYDRTCLVDLYKAVTRDEQLFPPRCCKHEFDFDVVRRCLPVQLASLYQEKAIEYRTTNRVYCHRKTCSAFLGEQKERPALLYCPRCTMLTCAMCKGEDHPGRPCDSQSDEEVLALADEAGWKRCPGCRHLVELSVGCFHMTCRCRYQFCYLCAARWKTCSCRQWDEHRIVNAAQDAVEQRLREEPQPAGGNNPNLFANFQALVEQEVERLRVDHDCQHTSWQYRSGRGRCEHCNFMLPIFLLRCRGCGTMACVRCRRNRL